MTGEWSDCEGRAEYDVSQTGVTGVTGTTLGCTQYSSTTQHTLASNHWRRGKGGHSCHPSNQINLERAYTYFNPLYIFCWIGIRVVIVDVTFLETQVWVRDHQYGDSVRAQDARYHHQTQFTFITDICGSHGAVSHGQLPVQEKYIFYFKNLILLCVSPCK